MTTLMETNLSIEEREEQEAMNRALALSELNNVIKEGLLRAHEDEAGNFVLEHPEDTSLVLNLGYTFGDNIDDSFAFIAFSGENPLIYRFNSVNGMADRTLVIGGHEQPSEKIQSPEIFAVSNLLSQCR